MFIQAVKYNVGGVRLKGKQAAAVKIGLFGDLSGAERTGSFPQQAGGSSRRQLLFS